MRLTVPLARRHTTDKDVVAELLRVLGAALRVVRTFAAGNAQHDYIEFRYLPVLP